jgi:hypothetical protein
MGHIMILKVSLLIEQNLKDPFLFILQFCQIIKSLPKLEGSQRNQKKEPNRFYKIIKKMLLREREHNHLIVQI